MLGQTAQTYKESLERTLEDIKMEMSRNTKTFFQMLFSSREAKEKIPSIMTYEGET